MRHRSPAVAGRERATMRRGSFRAYACRPSFHLPSVDRCEGSGSLGEAIEACNGEQAEQARQCSWAQDRGSPPRGRDLGHHPHSSSGTGGDAGIQAGQGQPGHLGYRQPPRLPECQRRWQPDRRPGHVGQHQRRHDHGQSWQCVCRRHQPDDVEHHLERSDLLRQEHRGGHQHGDRDVRDRRSRRSARFRSTSTQASTGSTRSTARGRPPAPAPP